MSNPITFERKTDKQIERHCAHCGTTIFVTLYRKDAKSFCNATCRNEWAMINLRGESNPLFKHGNGYERSEDGRVRLYMPNHPNADASGLVYRYRVVVEQSLGRYLTPDEHVHHKDLDCTNDHPSNLEVLSKSEHMRLHHQLRRALRAA